MTSIEPLITSYSQLPKAISDQTTRIILGELTPSKGAIAETTRYAHDHQLSLTVMIRPREGTTHYSDPELKIMEADVLEAQQLGADGIIVSATTDGHLDTEAMANLVAAAGGMSITFGTAIDTLSAQATTEALTWLAANGVDRVLTANTTDTAALSKLNNTCQAAGLMLTVLTPDAGQAENIADQLNIQQFVIPVE